MTERILIEDEFDPGFAGTFSEHQWIKQSLGGFYEDKWFTDILYRAKGGKEATVYCCQAGPAVGAELLAAKVYRPRAFRAMKNDSLYRQGREMLDAEGKPIRDSRAQRAIRKNTRFGRQLKTASWNLNEYKTMQAFAAAGADVPRPLAHGRNAILMEFVGDRNGPAPVLQRVRLGPNEAERLFRRIVRNVELMLSCGRIHADLSAYNVLYWQGEVKVIDFPQAVPADGHPQAFALLTRDLDRICRYFARQGVRADANALACEMWRRYMNAEI